MSEKEIVRQKALEYFHGDELAADVFLTKYSLNKLETPDKMHHRLAKEYARIELNYSEFSTEKWYKLSDYGKKRSDEFSLLNNKRQFLEDKIYNLFKDFRYIIPGGSVMQGLSSRKPVSLSNCFVIGSPCDSIEGIFNAGRDAAQIYKRRGGCGLDISNLRPNGSMVNNSANTSTGSVSFMKFYSDITNLICQEGRRGALMLSQDVRHPDIFEFINSKSDLTKITGANISVKLLDEFYYAVLENKDYVLRYPCDSEVFTNDMKEYNCYNELFQDKETGQYYRKIKAKDLWDNIILNAWKSAEPGILIWDNIINFDPTSVYPELKPICTNPCGELPLSAYDSCRLSCVNLYSLVDKPFTEEATFNSKLAYEIFYEQQCLADDLIDLEIEAVNNIINVIQHSEYFHKNLNEWSLWGEIRDMAMKGRRTGCGITGLADTCAALNQPYNEYHLIDDIFKIKLEAELDASIDMAIIRGAFPLWDKNKEINDEFQRAGRNRWYDYMLDKFTPQMDKMRIYGRRNAGLSTIAPTGSISILTQTTSGIEPLFQPYYTRRKKCNSNEVHDYIDYNGVKFKNYLVVHPKLIEYTKIKLEKEGHPIDLVEDFGMENWQLSYENSPYYKQTANDIDWERRVFSQSIIQRYITSSISSTINLPEDTPVETIDKIYRMAISCALKGITVYRDKCRSGILVTKDKEFKEYSAPKRPKELEAYLHLTKSKGRQYAVVVGLFEGKPYEVFVFDTLDTELKEQSGKITKLKQGHYKFEGDITTIENLNESGNSDIEKACALYTSMLLRHGANINYVIKTSKKIDNTITSFVSAMCRVLNKYNKITFEETCPECNGKLITENGCSKCQDCGYSKCG